MTNEELDRAVERLTADLTANHAMTLGGAVVRTADLRLLLSERGELLATVERMRCKVDGYRGPRKRTPQPDALPGDLREKIAAIIVRKVLQEDYDDLVEGYLDEILMAADEIILLPAYQAVAQTYYDNLARAALTTGEATNAGERG